MITLSKLKAIVIELKQLEEEAKKLKEKQEKAVNQFNSMLRELENGKIKMPNKGKISV